MCSTEELIENVKNYPILYDMSHEDYRNTRKKDKTWDTIAAMLEDEEGGEGMKKKFKNLRDAFARAIRQSQTRTGQAAKNTKKWQWWDQMQFFRPFLAFAQTTSNVSGKKRPATSTQKDTYVDVENETEDVEDIPEDEFERTIAKTEATSTSSSKRKKKSGEVSSVDTLVNFFNNKKKSELDDVDMLFLAHAKTIKTFSKKRQILAKIKIAEIIMQQEMLNFDEDTTLEKQPQPPAPEKSPFRESTPEESVDFSMDSQAYDLSLSKSPERNIQMGEQLPGTGKVVIIRNESLQDAIGSGSISMPRFFTVQNSKLY